MHVLLIVTVCYLLINFLCALVLHLHGMRQVEAAPRFLDVLMHFLLFGALALPLLVVLASEAFFGRESEQVEASA